MNRKLLTAALALLCGSTLSLSAGKTAVEKFDAGATKLPDGSYSVKSGRHTFSSDIIPVKNLAKETIVTIDFKAPDGGIKNTLYYLGIVNFDKNGKRIEISYVNPVRNSGTVLVAPCKKTDTVLKVKNAEKFVKNTCMAYDVKNDFSDLPNFTAKASVRIRDFKNKGDHWEVLLSKPCGVEYPANTPVRAHYDGWYQYLICGHTPPANGAWKKYTIKIAGTQIGNPGTKWTVGTAGIKFIVFNNGKNTGKEGMFFRNLTITTPDK